jgi:hypothetical protein
MDAPNVMHGRGFVILRMENNHALHEHSTLEDARKEATRLVESVGGTFVIYAPVVQVAKPPQVIETPIAPQSVIDGLVDYDDLPF